MIGKSIYGKMTGYYEPEISATRERKPGSYPILKNPKIYNKDHILKLNRKEIDNLDINDEKLIIAWAENFIEAFFLHIQGSGRLKLEDGKIIKVKYAGSNNKKYTSIGSILIKKQALKKETVNMFSLKRWLYKNQEEAKEILEKNERYIFFEEYKGDIKGSSNVKLLPNISVAVDHDYIKSGTFLIIQDLENNPSTFIAIAHDRGSAIKGANRIDLFTGFGEEAEKKAAKLNSKIRIWKISNL